MTTFVWMDVTLKGIDPYSLAKGLALDSNLARRLNLNFISRLNRLGYSARGGFILLKGIHSKRYVVVSMAGEIAPSPTNGEVRYQKSRKTWALFVNGKLTHHEFKTLKAAKLSFSDSILDQLTAIAVDDIEGVTNP